ELTTVEIFVVTTDDLEGYDINEYSYRVFNQWGIGKEDVNNGLLITYYYEDINETHYAYDFRIEVGRGLEPIITDSIAGRIGRDNMTVWFDYGYIYEGLEEGIVQLYDTFKDDPSIISGGGVFNLQTWAYENPLLAGVPIGIGLMAAWTWVQFSMAYRRRAIIPLAVTVGLVGFAWWLDASLQVMFYAVAIALGVTVTIRGSSRFRSGGGRTEGGGWTRYLLRTR
ncbi:TPM domain-containing protein, partial [Candidatus Thorarchaeota archaeon]